MLLEQQEPAAQVVAGVDIALLKTPLVLAQPHKVVTVVMA
jgi:hypothetical protein